MAAIQSFRDLRVYKEALKESGRNPKQHKEHDIGWERIGGMLMRMMDRADTFCRVPK